MARIQVLHEPNLNLLDSREPGTIGSACLQHIENALTAQAGNAGHDLRSFQTNAEHQMANLVKVYRMKNVICGFGSQGYEFALSATPERLA